MSIWVLHGGETEHQVQRLVTSRKVCGLNHGLEREKPQLFIWAKEAQPWCTKILSQMPWPE